jgi:hypothetical protein
VENTKSDVLAPDKHNRLWVAHNGSKIPLRADMRQADVTNPDDWSTYDQISTAIAGKPDLGHGLVLTPPYVGIDLDTYKTTDPIIIAIHKWIHDELFAGTYSELSLRGGVHILCKGVFTCSRRNLSRIFVELKDENKYLTYTENTIHTLPCIECPHALSTLSQWVDKYFPPPSFEATSSVDLPEVNTDDEVCTMAAQAFNGELFKALYSGNWHGRYDTQSEADQALANIIAFYTDSRQQTARLFLSSELGKRPKAQRLDYLYSQKYGLVTLAFDQKLPLPDMSDLGEKFKQLAAAAKNGTTTPPVKAMAPPAPAPAPAPAIEIVTQFDNGAPVQWEKPPGLLGDIADYVYQAAPYPNQHVALAAAIGFFAGLVGRAYNTVTGTGLNQYIALLGRTGIGKEAAHSGISRLCNSLRTVAKESLRGFAGPAEIASPQALMRHLVEKPSMCSFKGEFGIWMQNINSPRANPHEAQLKRLLLDLFNKSGKWDTLDGAIYSDKSNNVPLVNAPAFTFIGDSTLDPFYKGIDQSNIDDGLVSRLTVISCPDVQPVYNACAGNIKPSDELLTALERLIPQICFINQSIDNIIQVTETVEAKAYQLDYQKVCQDIMWEDRKNPISQVWNRAHKRMLRLGTLVAVGANRDYPVVHPVVEVTHYKWARQIIEHGVSVVSQRFESGDVGNTTLGFKQRQLVGRILLEYADSKWNQKLLKSYRITEIMHQNGGIPYSYIQQRVKNMLPFAQEERNAIQALTNAIESFIKVEALSEWETVPVEGNTRRKAIVYRIIDKSKLM